MTNRPALAIVLLLAACAHYEPRPLSVGAMTDRGQPAAIDPDAVKAELLGLAPSRPWDGVSWDEISLLAAALAYNPDLRAALAGAAAAAAEVRAAQVSPGPTLTLTAEYAFNPTESSPWLFGLATDQLLDFGGKRRARIADADIAAKASTYSFGNAVWNARSEIATAIAAVKSSSDIAALYDKIAPLRNRQVTALRNQRAEGEASSLDLERIRQAAASDASAAAAARSESRAARLSLARAIGVAPAAVDALTLESGAPDPARPLPPDLRANALQARPDIFDAVVAYDRSEAALRAAVAAQYPEIHVGPGYMWERGLSKLPFNLTLSFPSADFGAAGIAAAEARREEAARNLEAAVATAERSVDAAHETYRAALEAFEIARVQTLPAARAIAAQADRAMEAGAVDRSTWADAKIGALAAAIDGARAELALITARVALENALRRSFDNPAFGEAVALRATGTLDHE
jgi:CRISPR system Cascade subunit CasA